LHAIVLLAFLQVRSSAQTPAATSYDEGLKPILAKSCSGCHTFGGHAGGLQLDSYQSVL
jgi:mono/diheme cytochrome c family protein